MKIYVNVHINTITIVYSVGYYRQYHQTVLQSPVLRSPTEPRGPIRSLRPRTHRINRPPESRAGGAEEGALTHRDKLGGQGIGAGTLVHPSDTQ